MDGMAILDRRPLCARGLRRGRVAFYFHFYDPGESMQWTYGEFSSPPVSEMPTRLTSLMPYYCVD